MRKRFGLGLLFAGKSTWCRVKDLRRWAGIHFTSSRVKTEASLVAMYPRHVTFPAETEEEDDS